MHCPYFGTCGGCTAADQPYQLQLERKRQRLANLLGIAVPPLVPSPREAGFRSKVTFVFGTASGRLVMGHFAAGTNRIVAVDQCPVHSDRGNRIAFALRDQLARAGVRAADTRGGVLRHVIVRTSEDQREAVAMLVVTRNDRSLRAPVRALLASQERPDGFFVNINDRPGPYMVGRDTIRIDGRGQVRETGLGATGGGRAIDFLISPTAFFQTNVGAARVLLQLVTDAVAGASTVLDLYGGSGLFALPLAARGARVTVVEENRQAVADLQANVRLNRLSAGAIEGLAMRVEDALVRIERTAWDAVVLDPPREGCPPGVLASVFGRLRPERAVYVSCNPEALARDLPLIAQRGYRVGQVQAVDMFPHTDHIETVVELRRRTGR